MQFTLKRKLAISTTVLAAAAFAGGAYAATQDSSASSRQAFLNDVAKRLNVKPQQLSAALQGAFFDQLDAAVTAGKLTQAQANAIKQRVKQDGTPPLGFEGPGSLAGPKLFGAPDFPGGPDGGGPDGAIPRLPGAPDLPGGAPELPGGAPELPGGAPELPGGARDLPGRPAGPEVFGHGGRLSAVAAYLGISEVQLLNELSSGKSLAQIAAARGKSASGLKDAMTAAVRSRLDKAVAAKLVTATQEKQILSKLSSVLDFEINHSGIGWGFGGRGLLRNLGSGKAPDALPAPPSGGKGADAVPAPPSAAGPVY